jgi:hypothetical protein
MTISNEQFEKSLASLRKIELNPDEKGKMFGKLLRYSEANPAPEREAFLAGLLRVWRKLVSVVS